MTVTIEKVASATAELVSAFDRLLPQLSDTAPRLSLADLSEIVASSSTSLLVARAADRRIVGTASVVFLRIPSGRRARIESLIVDQGDRGAGVGRALCEAAFEHARQLGAESIDLTSSHTRVEANALYRRLGFELRASNTYRYRL